MERWKRAGRKGKGKRGLEGEMEVNSKGAEVR